MRFSCIISLVLASTAASAMSVERQRHAQRASVVEDPAYSRSADGAGNDAGLIEMYIGLDAQDRVQLERVLHQVSDPNHDDYGKHLSRDEAKDLLRPPAGAFDSVKRWLLDEGVAERHIEDRGQWVRARVPADIASKSKRGLGLGDVSSVPQHARRYISMIRPIHAVSSSRKRNAKPEPRAAGGSVSSHGTSRDVHGTGVNLTECITTVTPACIHELYHISDLPAIPHPKSLFGVPGFNNVSSS